jgi:hypothetical protein
MFGMTEDRELVSQIVAEMAEHGLEPDAKERELLALAEGIADRLSELEYRITADGLSITLHSGRVLMNPAVAKARMTRTALASVLVKISMTEAPAKHPVKQAASQTRWRAHTTWRKRGCLVARKIETDPSKVGGFCVTT